MTIHSLAKLACRVLALYALIQAALGLVQAFGAWMMPRQGQDPALALPMLSLSLTTFLGYVVVGALFWFGAEQLARWMTSGSSTRVTARLTYQSWQALAFSVVGLVLLAQAAVRLAEYGVSVLGGALNMAGGYWGQPVVTLLQGALGFWLMLGARNLAVMLGSPRSISASNPQERMSER